MLWYGGHSGYTSVNVKKDTDGRELPIQYKEANHNAFDAVKYHPRRVKNRLAQMPRIVGVSFREDAGAQQPSYSLFCAPWSSGGVARQPSLPALVFIKTGYATGLSGSGRNRTASPFSSLPSRSTLLEHPSGRGCIPRCKGDTVLNRCHSSTDHQPRR